MKLANLTVQIKSQRPCLLAAASGVHCKEVRWLDFVGSKIYAGYMPIKSDDVSKPFDPLAVENIGVTLAVELLEQDLSPLPPENSFPGAGVYAIYYVGDHPAYAPLLAMDNDGGCRYPVYIGKAVRENAKQGFNPSPTKKASLFGRLKNHAKSIQEAMDAGIDTHIKLSDFRCRYLVLNDAYITLAESVLITTFRPAWNGMGLGSNGVGGPRMAGKASLWDSLHPGRAGRPTGDAARAAEAALQIKESIDKLGTLPSDPRAAKMLEKIRRFVSSTS